MALELNGPSLVSLFLTAYSILPTATGWAFYSGLVTIPTGYTSAQLRFYIAGPDNTVLPDWYHTNVSLVEWNPFIFDFGTNCVLIAPQSIVDPVLTQLILNYDILPRIRVLAINSYFLFSLIGQ